MVERTQAGLLRKMRTDITLLQRRLARAGGGGGSVLPISLGVHRVMAADQSVANSTWTTALVNTAVVGIGTIPYSAGVFTVPKSGIWTIQASIGSGTFATATGRRVGRLLLNGVDVLAQDEMQVRTNAPIIGQVGITRYFTAGDTLELQWFHTQGAAATLASTPQYTYFSMGLVSAMAGTPLSPVTLALSSLFVNGTPAQTPEAILEDGWVQLQGGWQMAAGTSPVTPAVPYNTQTPLLNLPSGWRPTRQLDFPSSSVGATGDTFSVSVRVAVNGDVIAFAGRGTGSATTTAVMSLGGVRYRAA